MLKNLVHTSQYFKNKLVGGTSAAFDLDTIERKHVHISSLISKYYKNSSVLRKKYKLALLFDDVLTSFATILTDLSTSSTVVPEDLELGQFSYKQHQKCMKSAKVDVLNFHFSFVIVF